MNEDFPLPNDSSTSTRSQTAHDTQRRVRLLSATGVGSVLLMLIISTALFAWHHDSRKEANDIEAQLNEARMAMSRATIGINSEWADLVTHSPKSKEKQKNLGKSLLRKDLVLVEETCNSLNAALKFDQDSQLCITVNPLMIWSEEAEQWKQKHGYLSESVEQQYKTLDSLLLELQTAADQQRGIQRLQLAVGLRSHFSENPKPIAEILRDWEGTALANQLSGDVTQLRLNLSLLMATNNVDLLADISQNRIRPLLLRLKATSEELGNAETIDQIETAIFNPVSDANEPATSPPGIHSLQHALAEHRSAQMELASRAEAHSRALDNQRSKLALSGIQLQNQLTQRFANTFRTAWSIIFASAIILGISYAVLTRKVSEDITLQVDAIDRVAKELANEQLLLTYVTSSLPIPLYWKDAKGRYQGCSRAYAEWLGLTSVSQVIGRTDFDLPWDEKTSVQKNDIDNHIIRAGAETTNTEMIKSRLNGKCSVVLASKTPLRNTDDAIAGMVGAYIDITHRKASEVRLNGLAKIMSECPSETYVFDMSTYEVLEMNRAACQNLGIEPGGYQGKLYSDFNTPSYAQRLPEFLVSIIDGKSVEVEYESTHVRTNGSTYPVHVRALTIEHGSKKVFVACATDLTSYKKLESKLAQAQKLESIGQLATGIAHEINTPMQCICGNIEFLQTYTGRLLNVVDALEQQLTHSPEAWEHRLARMNELMKQNRFDFVRQQVPMAIEESANAANKVVEIVRAMKVMSHPGTQNKMATDLNALIRDAATLSRNRWKYAAEVEFQLEEALPTIEALPAELSQVFLNLLVNSADAIADKLGPDPTVLGKIEITTKSDDDNVYIELRDNGCGMLDEVKAKVFEPFFTTKDVGKGTGQGLSITYDVIVKLHGGSIDIQSTVGEGTLFELCLPRCVKAERNSIHPLAIVPVVSGPTTAQAETF